MFCTRIFTFFYLYLLQLFLYLRFCPYNEPVSFKSYEVTMSITCIGSGASLTRYAELKSEAEKIGQLVEKTPGTSSNKVSKNVRELDTYLRPVSENKKLALTRT